MTWKAFSDGRGPIHNVERLSFGGGTLQVVTHQGQRRRHATTF